MTKVIFSLLIASCLTNGAFAESKNKDKAKATAQDSAKEKTEKNVTVIIKTNKGEIEVELDSAKAPGTVKNFLNYVSQKHYDGTIFHRVIKKFMIQGGGFDPKMNEKSTSGSGIKNEAGNGLKNLDGTIAMARTSEVDSAKAQFFINTKDNDFLNHRDETMNGFGYAVFGKVTKGMDVVRQIESVSTKSSGMYDDVPVEPVIIESIRKK